MPTTRYIKKIVKIRKEKLLFLNKHGVLEEHTLEERLNEKQMLAKFDSVAVFVPNVNFSEAKGTNKGTLICITVNGSKHLGFVVKSDAQRLSSVIMFSRTNNSDDFIGQKTKNYSLIKDRFVTCRIRTDKVIVLTLQQVAGRQFNVTRHQSVKSYPRLGMDGCISTNEAGPDIMIVPKLSQLPKEFRKPDEEASAFWMEERAPPKHSKPTCIHLPVSPGLP